MFAWNINSGSTIHSSLFLFIHSLYNEADVWRADHNPVYERRERERERRKVKSNLMYEPWLTAAPYCDNSMQTALHRFTLKEALMLSVERR